MNDIIQQNLKYDGIFIYLNIKIIDLKKEIKEKSTLIFTILVALYKKKMKGINYSD